jgi:hypothetical protein
MTDEFWKALEPFKGQFTIYVTGLIRHKDTYCCPIVVAAHQMSLRQNERALAIADECKFASTAEEASAMMRASDLAPALLLRGGEHRALELRTQFLAAVGLEERTDYPPELALLLAQAQANDTNQ